MRYVRDRISAFLVDMLFITILVTLTANVNYLNPTLYDMQDATEKYYEVYDKVMEEAEKDPENSYKILAKKLAKPIYNLEKTTKYYYLHYLIFVVIYFIIFQFWNNGQTLGKKIFKLRVVNNEDENPNIIQYIVRNLINGSSVVIGLNIVVLIRIICLFIGIGANPYFYTYMISQSLAMVLECVLFITLVFSRKNKALNDYIAGTKVISLRD